MRLSVKRDPRLPPLAWLLTHQGGADEAEVFAGAEVRIADGVFWEGVNPTPETPARVLDHHFPLCTGAVARADDICAFTPGHIMDRLFLVRDPERIYLSNCLAFALAAAKRRLSPTDVFAHWHFGVIRKHQQFAPLDQGRLEIFHNTNIAIARDNSVRLEAKPASPIFASYKDYIAAVHAYLKEIASALKGGLNYPYEPVAMVSTGYDSPAAAALAREIGATRALTISDSRHGATGDDDGTPIGEALRLKVSARAREDYKKAGLEAEKLFYVSALPEDIIFYPFKDDIAGALLFSGYKGDTMWDPSSAPVGTWSWDPGGATMQSFRVRVNFVHMPPAFFGWRHHQSLIDIGRSDVMKPWSIGGTYDRPVARRIAEDAGVPRALFGQKKMAVSATIGVDKDQYTKADELGVSEAFSKLLRERRRDAGLGTALTIFAGNAIHHIVARTHRLLYAMKGEPAPSVAPRREPMGLKRLVSQAADLRRPFLAPFTDLNFAALASTDLLAAEYPSLEELRRI